MRRHLLASVAVGSALLTALVPAGIGHAAGSGSQPAGPGITFALLGDTPYGDDQRTAFPALVTAINSDPGVRFVLHAGDVKNRSSTCDDARFADLAGLFVSTVSREQRIALAGGSAPVAPAAIVLIVAGS